MAYAADLGLIFAQLSAGSGASKVVVGLKVHPELRGYAKILAQAQGHIGAYGSLFANDLIDSREVQGLRQLVCGNVHRLKELGP